MSPDKSLVTVPLPEVNSRSYRPAFQLIAAVVAALKTIVMVPVLAVMTSFPLVVES